MAKKRQISRKNERKSQESVNFVKSSISKRKFQNIPLRQRMIERLKGSRFRSINEDIYKMPGKAAFKYFKEEPAAFQAYHDGYLKQLEQWPSDPLQVIMDDIKTKHKKKAVIADFGCGNARLAKSLTKFKVHSLDLVALDPCVTVCDMAATPLPSASIDIVVCCLSLMGTNLPDYVKEANRVLKEGGILKIAEVASRFEDIDEFINNLQSFGFKLKHSDFTNQLFYYMDFAKDRNIGKRTKKKLPELTLKACLYKKR